MKYCQTCGTQMDDAAAFCAKCGASSAVAPVAKPTKPTVAEDDAPDFLMALLGFFVPIVGLILFFIDREQRPKRAGSALKGAIVSWVLGFISAILYFVFYIVFIVGMTALTTW